MGRQGSRGRGMGMGRFSCVYDFVCTKAPMSILLICKINGEEELNMSCI